jgi:hypothetical protein
LHHSFKEIEIEQQYIANYSNTIHSDQTDYIC